MWRLKRTQNCGELRTADVGKSVILNGWVDVRRDFGSLIFVDLRDRHGKTQVIFAPDRNKTVHDLATKLRALLQRSGNGAGNDRLPSSRQCHGLAHSE